MCEIDNRDCYWANPVGSPIIGYDCCFNPDNERAPCKIDIPCSKYVATNKVDEYIRYLLTEIKILEKLP